jgi:hypothetical protein
MKSKIDGIVSLENSKIKTQTEKKRMTKTRMAGAIAISFGVVLTAAAAGRGHFNTSRQEAINRVAGSVPAVFDPGKTYPAKALKEDLKILWDMLEEGHGGLDRYTSVSELRKIYDEIANGLAGPLSEPDFYLRLLPLIAEIKDGHTALQLSPKASAFLDAQPVFFPFGLRFLNGRTYIFRNLSSEINIKAGAELLAINGLPLAEILPELLALIPSDAGIRTSRIRKLEFPAIFGRLLTLRFGRRDSFRLQLQQIGSRNVEEFSVPGITGTDIDGVLGARFPGTLRRRPVYEMSFQETAAVLTIRTFGDDPEPGSLPYPEFLENAFRNLEEKKTANLIIDLRGNGGGRDEYGKLLFAHIMDRPFLYYLSMEAKKDRFDLFRFTNEKKEDLEALAKFVQKNDRGRYDLLGHPNSGTQSPRSPRFAGRVAILIDGLSFSTTGEVVSLFHFNRKAVFFGEEGGSGYYGSTAGFIVWATLPHSGLQVKIPLFRCTLAVDGYAKDRGLIPDIVVSPTIEDLLTDRDPVMERALRFLEKK